MAPPEQRYEWYVLRHALYRFTNESRGVEARYLGSILTGLESYDLKELLPQPVLSPPVKVHHIINLNQELGIYLDILKPREPEIREGISKLLRESAPQQNLDPFLNRRIEQRTISFQDQSRIFEHYLISGATIGQITDGIPLYMITGIRSVPFQTYNQPIFAIRYRRIHQNDATRMPPAVLERAVHLGPKAEVLARDGYGSTPTIVKLDEREGLEQRDFISILNKEGNKGVEAEVIEGNEYVRLQFVDKTKMNNRHHESMFISRFMLLVSFRKLLRIGFSKRFS